MKIKNQAHTPGPWHFDPHDDEADVLSEYGQVARVFGSSEHDGSAKDDEGEANARLIAAAPDLLDALRELVEYDESGESSANIEAAIQNARAVIAKAEGK